MSRECNDEAYAAWELGHLQEAAELFMEAARIETAAAALRSPYATPDRTITSEARAAFCYWDAGDLEQARPLLRKVIQTDWKKARLWSDRHDTEKAFMRLILEAASQGNGAQFDALWLEASQRGQDLDYPFPTILPNQKKLLQAALLLERFDAVRQVLLRINPEHLQNDHELQLLKAMAEQRVEARVSASAAPRRPSLIRRLIRPFVSDRT
ncbi:hypothetical protein ABE85_19145 [Mitsuaria sp. 7]|nr:hypothetical protein ABE85_19145 [Mitsuaria sp. 7]